MRLAVAALLFAGLTAPVFAAGDTAPSHRLTLFTAVDFYNAANIDDDENALLSSEVTSVASAGNNSAGNLDTDSGGTGYRVGGRYAFSPYFDLGLSVGYVGAPDTKSTVDDLTAPTGSLERKVETSYLVGRLEAGGNVTLYKRLALRLGAGLGAARAKKEVTQSGSGSLAGSSASASDTSTGLTTEVSAAFLLRLGAGGVELGVRKSTFGPYNNWNPVSVFVGFSI